MKDSTHRATDSDWIPYRHPAPPEAQKELLILDVNTADERLWVPLDDSVWSRPLCFNIGEGYWTHLLRIRGHGIFNRHRHASPTHGYVVKGRWRYLEHDWVAEQGSYIFEPPGDTHTLVIPDDVEEMITFFHTTGTIVYVDAEGNATGFDDVFSRIATCKRHFESVGLGETYVQRFIH